MYGTVARIKIKPGAAAELDRLSQSHSAEVEGMVFQHVFQLDADPNVVMVAVGFKDKAAYVANANSPAQAKRYEQYRALAMSDPEWQDGEIISSFTR